MSQSIPAFCASSGVSVGSIWRGTIISRPSGRLILNLLPSTRRTSTSNADDKTTEFTYDGSNHMLTLKAHLTGGAYQKTEWVYGATTAAGSAINCNECLVAMKYPDKSSGDPSNSEKEIYTVSRAARGTPW